MARADLLKKLFSSFKQDNKETIKSEKYFSGYIISIKGISLSLSLGVFTEKVFTLFFL